MLSVLEVGTRQLADQDRNSSRTTVHLQLLYAQDPALGHNATAGAHRGLSQLLILIVDVLRAYLESNVFHIQVSIRAIWILL